MEKRFENHYQKLANQLAGYINTKDLGDVLKNEFEELIKVLSNEAGDEGKHYAAVLAEYYLSLVGDSHDKAGARGRR